MITVVGIPAWREGEPAGPAGRACDIAIAAAARGARVELVGRAGDDPAGDRLLLALARAGVGHAALLRDPSQPTPRIAAPPQPDAVDPAIDMDVDPEPVADQAPRLEPEDVELGLRYLTDFSVLVVTDDVPRDALAVAVESAAFAGARLVVLVPSGDSPPEEMPADGTVLAAPDSPDDGEFGALVGAYAAALDGGMEPADAFRAATGAGGWEVAPVDAG
jgi:sugar/nucleoside kinase (ribokinase family)